MRFLVPLLACLVGCSHAIGDACGNNVDCSIAGDRFCDIAPPGGYCTVEGCGVTSDGKDTCPGDSVCIRFFTAVQTRPCVYNASFPRGDATSDGLSCDVDERCVCDGDLAADDSCPTTAHCAPENSERRWCMARCGKDTDCRAGYVCRQTGSLGSEAVPSLNDPAGVNAKYCVSQSSSGPVITNPNL
jgi:hypothetical protein